MFHAALQNPLTTHSAATVSKVPDLVPVNITGFCFITGFRPATGSHLEITGHLCKPFELVGMSAHDHERVAQIDRMVGAKAKLSAGSQFAREQIHWSVVHHAPLGMARLGPGIGMEQVEKRKRSIGNASQHFQSVAMMDAHIADRSMSAAIAIDVGQCLRNAIQKRLGANKAVIWQHIGTECHVLTTTEANFKMQRTVAIEQTLRGHGPFSGHSDLRQQVIHQRLLTGAQRLTLGTAIKAI